MRNGFDIYRVGPDRNHQEPQSPWGWTPRRGEVPTGETVVQDHDYTLTYTGNDPQLAAAFARGARLMEIVTLWPELVVLPVDGRRLPPGREHLPDPRRLQAAERAQRPQGRFGRALVRRARGGGRRPAVTRPRGLRA